MASQRQKIQEDVRFRVMRLLEENPEMSQREIARAVGISAGSTHYLLGALVEKGLLKFGNFSTSEDKRRYAYILTPKGVAEIAEYEALKAEIEVLQVEIRQSSEFTRTLNSGGRWIYVIGSLDRMGVLVR